MADALPKWIDGLSYTGLSLRRGDILTGMHDGTALGVRAGVRPGGGGLSVTLSGSTITVTAGVAMVQYQSGQGAYRACLASSTNATLTAAHATLSRIDLVYLRVWDNAVDGSGLNQADAVYLTGTPASSPVAPAPGGTQIYIPLATITVPPAGGGSPTVSTAVTPFTVAPGGILPSPTAPAAPHTGQAYYASGNLMLFNGSSWDTYLKAPGAWTAWTPAWSTSTGLHLPSFGNAVIDCRYSKLGRTVLYYMHIVFGTTTNFGSGATAADNWTLSIPVPAATSGISIGTASIEPGHSTRASTAMAQVNTDLTTTSIYMTSPRVDGTTATGVIDSVSPFTWGSGMRLEVSGQYEAAS
ncbi:hypothetical protein ACJ6WF_16895 [Streptomyces sp. MMS24-I2-30]|uniref:hypothetical protein n=1 Tax=Streptomyces sp. MMS24-I2-30 TaxID=3351564 RepID=UPI003896DD1D